MREPNLERRPARRATAGRGLAVAAAVLAAMLAGAASPAGAAPGSIGAQRVAIRGLEADLFGLDARAQTAARAQEAARGRLAMLRARIRANARALVRARRDHRLAQARLAERLRAIYREDQPSLLVTVLTSRSLSEAASTYRMLTRIGRQDADVVGSLDEARARMAALDGRLRADRRRTRHDVRVAGAARRRLEAAVARQRVVLVRSRAVLARMIAWEQQRRTEQARRARLATLRAAQARVSARLVAHASPATPQVAAAPAPARAEAGGSRVNSYLEAIAQCESGADPTAVSPGGRYRGKYQFDPATWRAMGGSGDPAAAPEAEQDRRAAALYARSGSAPWPICGN